MATLYVPHRSKRITVQQIRTLFPDVIISDNDIEKGNTVDTPDVDLGVQVDGDTTWISFNQGVMVNLNIYGRNRGHAIDMINIQLDADCCSEHEDGFAEHIFPVDVKTTAPWKEHGKWQFFEHNGLIYPYDKQDDAYYDHVWCTKEEFNMEKMIDECE